MEEEVEEVEVKEGADEEDEVVEDEVMVKMVEEENEEEEDGVKFTEGEEKEGQGKLQKKLPKINKTRRRRNILVGWLCSRIVKAFVKKKVLL